MTEAAHARQADVDGAQDMFEAPRGPEPPPTLLTNLVGKDPDFKNTWCNLCSCRTEQDRATCLACLFESK